MKRDYKALLCEGRKAQIEKLKENDHKCGFDIASIKDSFKLLHIEMQELSNEIFVEEPDYKKIRREAADVANFAFMIILKSVRMMYRQKRK